MMLRLPVGRARYRIMLGRILSVVSMASLLSLSVRWTAAQEGHLPSETAAVHRQTLRRLDVEPSAIGAVEYLQNLHPSPERKQQITALIDQLGNASFAKREAAMQTLLRMPVLPIAQLNTAVAGKDPEVRWRAIEILKLPEGQIAQTIYASFKVISADATDDATAEPIDGAVAALLDAMPLCEHTYLRWAAIEALHASATVDDTPLLRAALVNGRSPSRVAAASALCAVTGTDDRKSLYPLFEDRDDSVALEVARSLADYGDRASLKTLVRLLGSEDHAVRTSAVVALRGTTGQHMGFVPSEPADKRYEATKKWNTWVTSEGPRAKLVFPIPRHISGRGDLGGKTLVATGSKNQVKLFDASGKEIWTYPLGSWSAEKLLNGNILIGSQGGNKIIEVNPASGKVVWEYPNINCIAAKPLVDGNIIASDFRGKRVVEITRDKKIAWEHETGQTCFDCDRLPNGNTIFGCPNYVREVTHEGKLVREWKIDGRLNGFQALPNGNILVANFGKNEVVELSPEGVRVWEFQERSPCDVFRLPSGNTLISTHRRIIEISPDNKVIREICSARYGSARM